MWNDGYSLTEWLAALATVLVLLVMSYGVSQHSAAKARQARCLQQLRQIGVLFSVYLGDYRFRYPLATRNAVPGDERTRRFWAQDLVEHSGNKANLGLFLCPGVKNPMDQLKELRGGYAYVSYGINRYGVSPHESETPWLHPANHLLIEEPSRLLLLIDYDTAGQPYEGWYSAYSGGMELAAIGRTVLPRHRSLNVLFCDGSVRQVSQQEVAPPKSTNAYPWGVHRFTLHR